MWKYILGFIIFAVIVMYVLLTLDSGSVTPTGGH
ncbi:hypothetical protein EV687_3134 [Corticibacter populi]|nr:hypothetical protein EV687_3134 [Corticibacter populi]